MTAQLLDRAEVRPGAGGAREEIGGAREEIRGDAFGVAREEVRRRRPSRSNAPVGPGGGPDRRTTAWAPAPARACSNVAPAAAQRGAETSSVTARPGTGRLVWTPRGIAVMVMAVAVVVGVMTTALVSGFLAVSNEPLGPSDAPMSAAVVVAATGHGG